MGFILLVVIPIVVVICIVFALKWTGTSIIPKGLRLPPGREFKFPKITRIPGGWIAEPTSDDEFDSDSDDPEFDDLFDSGSESYSESEGRNSKNRIVEYEDDHTYRILRGKLYD